MRTFFPLPLLLLVLFGVSGTRLHATGEMNRHSVGVSDQAYSEKEFAWTSKQLQKRTPAEGRPQTRTPEDLEQILLEEHQKLFAEQLNIGLYPKTDAQLEDGRKRMKDLFERLKRHNAQPMDLNEINELRLKSVVVPEDKGRNVPWGTPWKFELHGPYPAQRFAGGMYTLLRNPGFDRKLATQELSNAHNVIQLEEQLADRHFPTFTDHLQVLKAAYNYHKHLYATSLATPFEMVKRIRIAR